MKIKGIVHCELNGDPARESSYSVWANDMTAYGYICMGPVEFEITPLSQEEFVAGAISGFRKKQQEIRAQAESQITTLDEQIQKLLCLSHSPEVPDGESVLQEPTGTKEFYVTYGGGSNLEGFYSTVRARDYNEARTWIDHVTGGKFAFVYGQEDFESAINHWDLVEVPLQAQVTL